jgi:phosphoserine phosphatase
LKRLIAFDVDSTLIRVESLDFALEMALETHPDSTPSRARLHDITIAGMTGQMPMRQSLEARLELAELSRDLIRQAGLDLRQYITPKILDILDELRSAGNQIHAVSGGFFDLLEPVLTDLGFSPDHIHTNHFQYEGDCVSGIDSTNPLSHNGGKAKVLQSLAGPDDHIIMIGDGMTDFEAYEQGIAHRFIGFGVIEKRDAVIAKANAKGGDFVYSIHELRAALAR